MYLRYETPEVFPKHRHISPTTLLVFVTLFVFSTFSLVTSVLRSNDDVSWDLLIFTQNWPVSVCRKYTEESKTNKCTKFPNNTWTIHGLWPTKKGKIGPNFCNKSRPFSPEAIYGIEEELEKWWSPVEVHKSKYMFWSHEWEKHGTCAAVLPQFATEFDYFYQVLQLIKQYNITEILAKAGITPGQSYNVTKIWDGVKGVLNKNPQIFCYEEKGNVSVLLEVRICLDKSLNLVDCDGTVVGYEPRVDPWIRGMRYKRLAGGYHNLTNCKIERPVQFPPGYMMFTPENTPEVQTQTETNSLLENLKILRLAEWFTG